MTYSTTGNENFFLSKLKDPKSFKIQNKLNEY
jgi:hypothetical protein